jgi:predicted transcriptional regulator
LPEEKREVREATKQQRFISSLPMTFTRKEAVDIATSLGWSEKTCDTYLSRLCDTGTIERAGRGEYRFASSYN